MRSFRGLLEAWAEAVAGTDWPQPPHYEGVDKRLTRLTEKTSEVDPGACFIARVRTGSDGHPYIGEALARGAIVILGQRPAAEIGVPLPATAVYLQVADTAAAMAWLAAAWEGFPARDLFVIGITGTDGKTSTANMLFSILRTAGLRAGLLSTVKAVIGAEEEPLELHVTTPEAPVVQRYLRRMSDAGLTHCIVEATSHGLAQQRVGAIDFDLALVTNITHEHLDYHGDYEQYFLAKARLFAGVASPSRLGGAAKAHTARTAKIAVLNQDDQSFERLLRVSAGAKVLTYGLRQGADVTAKDIIYSAGGTRFLLQTGPGIGTGLSSSVNVTSALVGEFNVYNMLAAATAALAMEIDPHSLAQGLQALTAISGRMEPIDLGQPFQVLVDFAHTPNALKKAIAAVRSMTEGQVIAVFGSAGKRDREKRVLMAEISARDADKTILTAEDPRTESLDHILETMAGACRRAGTVEGESFWRIGDRGRAIHFALQQANAGDAVLICGKGHEQSMCFGTTEYPWDDRQAARVALEAWKAGRSMPDLGLPTFTAPAADQEMK